jgi:hypothetical protein
VPDTLVLYEVRDGKIVNAWFAPRQVSVAILGLELAENPTFLEVRQAT